MRLSDAVKGFAPGWFGVVMGTGAFALVTNQWLPTAALLLHYLNLVFLVVIGGAWVAKCLLHPESTLAGMRHPVVANFYPMAAIALMVVGNQFLVLTDAPGVGAALWGAGALMAVALSYVLLSTVFQGSHVTLDHITPANYLPAVGLVVVPVVGARMLTMTTGVVQESLLLVNSLALGTGVLMYLALFALTVHKLILAPRQQGALAATIWIQLAPAGLIPVAMLNLVCAVPAFESAKPLVMVLALLMVGFGVWWLGMAIMLTRQALKNGELPFALSWWAFTFPLGALTLGLLAVMRATSIGLLAHVAFACWLLLAGIWLAVLLRTVSGVRSGDLLKG